MNLFSDDIHWNQHTSKALQWSHERNKMEKRKKKGVTSALVCILHLKFKSLKIFKQLRYVVKSSRFDESDSCLQFRSPHTFIDLFHWLYNKTNSIQYLRGAINVTRWEFSFSNLIIITSVNHYEAIWNKP